MNPAGPELPSTKSAQHTDFSEGARRGTDELLSKQHLVVGALQDALLARTAVASERAGDEDTNFSLDLWRSLKEGAIALGIAVDKLEYLAQDAKYESFRDGLRERG